MVEGNGALIGGLMSPQRDRKMIGDLMKVDVELPLLEESLFDDTTPSMQTIKEDRFPPDLIFSPLKELCPNELLGYNELVPPSQNTVSSLKKASIEQYSFSRDAIPLPKDLFSAKSEYKPKAKQTRKKRRRGNSSKARRKNSKKAPSALIPRDPTPRMCTAPLCGTIHASVDKLRNHIKLCHPNMRMRCWFPGCMRTFLVPEDLEEHAMDIHMPKRESSFFSRTKIRFKELTEVPDDGEIRPTKERKQRSPRVPTAVEAYSCAVQHSSKKETIQEPSCQLTSFPIPSPVAGSKVMPPTVSTPVPSPSSRLDASVPFNWTTDVVENTTPTKLETGIEEFFCLDPNPRMPLWNERVTEMHTYWVSDRKRAGYTPEIEVKDTNFAKEDRKTLQTNITAFIAAHLSNLSAVMHVDEYNWSGRDGLSFTMDTPKGTVLARVTGMEYSIKEWNQKLSDAKSIIARGFFDLNNGKAIIDGSSCWGNQCTRLIQKAEEVVTGAGMTSGNVQWVNVTFRGIPMAFFVTARDVHAGELAYMLSGSSPKP